MFGGQRGRVVCVTAAVAGVAGVAGTKGALCTPNQPAPGISAAGPERVTIGL